MLDGSILKYFKMTETLVIEAIEHIIKVEPNGLGIPLMGKSVLKDNSKLDDFCQYVFDQYNDGSQIWLDLIKRFGENHIDNIMDYIEPKQKPQM